ncbi:P27 family phage terminase small subunit [Methylobacterium sp. E-045]|uniref:P27 family phage terminase small subunit n=1 Tax=Methylobacterium sp. E-045 TaxID=2836575 RepID=UPI001FBAEDB1|nr:P27 family phage terminase small subunit [Methylobacterium sp. E-045]MCJ2132462.1 P27 family phage terminase small subunit [Methylobacterium sp. E-045]
MPPTPNWSQTFVDEIDLAFAHEEWTGVINEMTGRGILSVANGHAIKRLVEFRVVYDRAARQLAEQGPIIKAATTGVPQINPYWTVMKQADEAVRTAEAELGLSPVRRSKATKVEKKTKVARAADAFLKPVAG